VASPRQNAKRKEVARPGSGATRKALPGIATTPASSGSASQRATSSSHPQDVGVGVDEVAGPGPARREAEGAQGGVQHVAAGHQAAPRLGQRGRDLAAAVELRQQLGYGRLQRRRDAEADPLAQRGDRRHERRRTGDPADLPAGDAEGLAGAADAEGPVEGPAARCGWVGTNARCSYTSSTSSHAPARSAAAATAATSSASSTAPVGL
jgi:hypothetical protein